MLRCVVNDVVPSLAFCVGACTLLVPFAIVRGTNTYVGGLAWPFVSDLSRDFPSSAVFAVGLNSLALLLMCVWTLNFRRHQRFLQTALLKDTQAITAFRWLSWTSNTLGTIGAAALPLYTFTTVTTSPQQAAGATFLGLEAVACFINSYLSYRICLATREDLETSVFATIKSAPRSVALEKLTALKTVKRGFLVELASSALFLMALLVYLPILYQVAPAQQLSVDDCLTRGLGDHYCNETVRLHGNTTSLWSYEADFAGFQVRAFAQLSCLVTLLAYTLSFVVGGNNDASNHEHHYSTDSRESPLLLPETAHDGTRGRRRSRSRAGSPSKQHQRRVRSPSGSPPKSRSFTSTTTSTTPTVSPSSAGRTTTTNCYTAV